jgi:general secretion pathway protein D
MIRSESTARCRVLLLAVLAGMLAACATRPPAFPEPLRGPNPVPVEASSGDSGRQRIEPGPVVPAQSTAAAKPADKPLAVPEIPSKKPTSLVLDGVPMASFINVVFGTELGFALEIDQGVRARPDLVSLRLTKPTSPEDLYKIGAAVLKDYGVDIAERGGVLRFTPVADESSRAPKLLTTRSLPDVPAGQRTVYVALPLDASSPSVVAGQLRAVVGTKTVTITEMLDANALLISGPGSDVQAAMEAALALDRASLRDKRSLRINPLYLPVDQLADELRNVLVAQGYSVRTTPGTSGVLTFVPVPSANALIVFSESEPALRAVTQWAEKLDQPNENDGGAGGVYMYSARHTTVETLLPVLQTMVGAGAVNQAAASAAGTTQPASTTSTNATAGRRPAAGRTPTAISGSGGQVAVDPIRNVIVYQGDPQRWRAIRSVLERLDHPAPQVVIEVTVAEVTLTDDLAHGIEWALRNVGIDGMNGPVTALGGSEPQDGSLVWRALSSSGQVKAVVNLFAKDSRVSILSTPRLMVKSGETASIDVGTEVPIITSQATAVDLPTTGGTSSILQSIQYRKTGVLLEIEAVVHSGQRVDLQLTQEVSEATPTDTSDISSPSIFSRKLQTSLSLSDGQSMLLGGLISSTTSDGKTKVPLLGDVPVLGRFFQNRNKHGQRTELLMLITPYVVEDADQAREITDALKARFGSGDSRFGPGDGSGTGALNGDGTP